MRRWQLQDAKAHLSEVVKSTVKNGPQEITVRGRAAAVVISPHDYRRLKKPRPTFLELIRSSPLVGSGIKVVRDHSLARKVRI